MEVHKLLEVVLELREEGECSLLFGLASEVLFKSVEARVEFLRGFILLLVDPFELGSDIGLKANSVLDEGKGLILKVGPVFFHVSKASRPLFFKMSVPSLPTGRVHKTESAGDSSSLGAVFSWCSVKHLGQFEEPFLALLERVVESENWDALKLDLTLIVRTFVTVSVAMR